MFFGTERSGKRALLMLDGTTEHNEPLNISQWLHRGNHAPYSRVTELLEMKAFQKLVTVEESAWTVKMTVKVVNVFKFLMTSS